jgi:MoaA/NifB/PqqE/SkfB family radical SAM enzyme
LTKKYSLVKIKWIHEAIGLFMSKYAQSKKIEKSYRLPLDGRIDLTYRCNNDCRHCWLRIPPHAQEQKQEISLDEIKRIVGEARKMGCREWKISGGEPMLRPDFAEIFDFITSQSATYTLNTNGTLITPEIARLMKKKGIKLVAIYGHNARIHDHITRNPGSFEAMLQGIQYLKESGAGFIVQIVPMKDNYANRNEMIMLAESLSPYWRFGATWLYLSASGKTKKNKEIKAQRLDPDQVVEIDPPSPPFSESGKKTDSQCYNSLGDNRLLRSCINNGTAFHIDPYAKMGFCDFISHSDFRFDLREGTFLQAWEEFIPSLTEKIESNDRFQKNCGQCEQKVHCDWCPAFSFLENREFTTKISYLCSVANERKKYSDRLKRDHIRFYGLAEIPFRIESDLPILDSTFAPKFKHFEISESESTPVVIKHHFTLPPYANEGMGKEVYRKIPWAISRKGHHWIYKGITSEESDSGLHRIAVFNEDHTRGTVFSPDDKEYRQGNLHSLTFFPTDQIIIARILADRQGCYLHSSGVIMDGDGFLFVGHSDAGKTTMARILKKVGKLLCDDRIILMKKNGRFQIFGTWSHGDMAEVSSDSAPLKALLFLEKDRTNRLVLLTDRKQIIRRFLACLIRPLASADWVDKMLDLTELVAEEVPCYLLHFNRSEEVIDILKNIEQR